MAAESPTNGGSLVVKILVLGDAGTGKSSLINRYVKDAYNADITPTLGVDFGLKNIRVDGKDLRLQLWDIAGQEHVNKKLSRVYYRDAFGVILVYDISRPETFETVSKWKQTIDAEVTPIEGANSLPVILVGNKSDLETREASRARMEADGAFCEYYNTSPDAQVAQLDNEYLDKFVKDHNFISCFDVSAYNGDGVNEMVEFLAKRIVEESGSAFEIRREKQSTFRPGAVAIEENEGGCC